MAVVVPRAGLEILELDDEILLRHPFEPGCAELVVGTAVATDARGNVTQRVADPHQRRRGRLVVARGRGARLWQRVVISGDVGNVAVGKAPRGGLHEGAGSIAAPVILQLLDDDLRVLAGKVRRVGFTHALRAMT